MHTKPSAKVDLDLNERAQLAVRTFRQMQHGLTAYARALTGSPKVRIEVAASEPHTDGTVIYYCPPIALGDKTPHDRFLCDKRDESGMKACPACRVREEVLVNIYHEIAHITFGSFANGANYLNDARRVNPFLPMIWNSLEDSRVDSTMFRERRGTKKMFAADVQNMIVNGIEQWDGSRSYYRDLPLNTQATMALYFEAADYPIWRDHFALQVVDDFATPGMVNIIEATRQARTADETYKISIEALRELRELGYFLTDEERAEREEEPEQEPEEQDEFGDEAEPEDNDNSEEGETDGDDDDSEGSDGESSDFSGDGPDEEGDDRSDSDVDAGGGEGGSDQPEEADDESPEGDDTSAGSGDGDRDEAGDDGDSSDAPEDQDEGSGDGTSGDVPDDPFPGRAEDEDEPDDAEAGEGQPDDADAEAEGSPGDDHGAGDPEAGEPSEDQEDGEASGESGDADSHDGSESDVEGCDVPDLGGPEEPESEDDPDSGPDRESGDQAEGGEDSSEARDQEVDDDLDTDSVSPEPSGSREDRDEDQAGDDSDSSASGGPEASLDAGRPDSDDAEADETEDDPSVEAVDSGDDQGLGGIEAEPLAYGSVSDVEEAMETVHSVSNEHDDETSDERQAVKTAVIQGTYFETPSANVSSVYEYRYGPDSPAWNTDAYSNNEKREFGVVCDTDIPESVLGPALLKTRRIFNDNQTSSYQPNLRSGRVNGKVLGRRAWSGDDRLFGKKRVPGRKDYAVQIMVDISSSNLGTNLVRVKRAVIAQAELLHRAGVKFSIMAHSCGAEGTINDYSLILQLSWVKDWDEPWSPEVRKRMEDIVAIGGNLDGHAMEFGRKQLRKVDATDKILLYYTDGKMPAANHAEELQILQREIKYCRRDGVTLLGVGMGTDSPVRHGLDTICVESDDDLKAVVDHLGKQLLRSAR